MEGDLREGRREDLRVRMLTSQKKQEANISSCRLRKVQDEKRQEEGRNECGSRADRR